MRFLSTDADVWHSIDWSLEPLRQHQKVERVKSKMTLIFNFTVLRQKPSLTFLQVQALT